MLGQPERQEKAGSFSRESPRPAFLQRLLDPHLSSPANLKGLPALKASHYHCGPKRSAVSQLLSGHMIT